MAVWFDARQRSPHHRFKGSGKIEIIHKNCSTFHQIAVKKNRDPIS